MLAMNQELAPHLTAMDKIRMLGRLLVLAALTLLADSATKMPSGWKTCRRSDPALNECLQKSIQHAVTEISNKGAPSLGVYPVDPLRVNKLHLSSGSGSINLDLTFSNMDIFGFKNLRIEQVTERIKDNALFLSKAIIQSQLQLQGDYTVKGRLLVVPLGGSGKCNITLSNPVTANAEIRWHLEKGPDGRNYMHADKFNFTFETKSLKLHFHDKDHGDTQLGATLNRIANDNSIEILNGLKPAIADAFGQAFLDIANRVFSKIPYEEIFPPK